MLLESAVKYSGRVPSRVLRNSRQVVSYVLALCGYTELAAQVEDIATQYFLDIWGSAYVQCTQKWFGKKISEELEKEGKARTYFWCPGQHEFEAENQKSLFELLRPDDIGCTLTKSFMMDPVKASSGILGIVEQGCTDLLLPCDFCTLAAACPSFGKGCAET